MINQQCLEEAIGSEETNELMAIYGKLPDGQSALLKLIAASLISSNSPSAKANSFLDSVSLEVETGPATPVAAPPDGAIIASITAFDNGVWFTLDGSTPADGNGHLIEVDTTININSDNLAALKFAPIDATTANLYISYFK